MLINREMQTFKINFDKQQDFESRNIKPLIGICGLYFIILKETEIPYPFGKSRLIYIDMSEKRTNSIGKRLSNHFEGVSGNEGIVNYKKAEGVSYKRCHLPLMIRS